MRRDELKERVSEEVIEAWGSSSVPNFGFLVNNYEDVLLKKNPIFLINLFILYHCVEQDIFLA